MSKSNQIKSNVTIDTIALFKDFASGLSLFESGKAKIDNAVAQFRESKLAFGKSVKTCQYRAQCLDAVTIALPGKSKKTYMNYVTAFVDAVESGKEFSLSSSKGSVKSTKPKSKSENDPALDALARVLKTDNGVKFLNDIQASYDNDEGSLLDIIKDLLILNGYEIKDSE